MKKVVAFIFVVLTIHASFAQKKTSTYFNKLGHTIELQSKILNQTKKVLVQLPPKFDSQKEYPLIVLSDFMAFKPLASTTEIMGYNKTIPPCIVICPMTTKRKLDYKPVIDDSSKKTNGGKTIRFYEKELLPYFVSHYKISKKIFWGQGYAGMFVTFVMLSNPSLFDAYFADIPELSFLNKQIKSDTVLKNIGNHTVFFQLSWTKKAPKSKTFQLFQEKLNNNEQKNFQWKYREEADPMLITHVLTSYTYALEAFLKKKGR